MVFVNELVGDKWQTVDHERGLRFETMHGRRDDYHFQLHMKGEIVNIYAVYDSKVYGNPKIGDKYLCDLYWQLRGVFIPSPLKERQEEILEIIENALKTRGLNSSQEYVHSVQVNLLENAIK